MTTVIHVVVFLIGATLVFATMASAVRTVVLPRAAIDRLTRMIFFALRRLLIWFSNRADDYRGQDMVLSWHAPLALLALPLVWASGMIGGFGLMYWAVGGIDFGTSLVVSGSSFTTLGFERPDTGPSLALSIVESLLGLVIVALLIAYLPSIYGSFSRREIIVADIALKSAGTMHGPSLIAQLADSGCLNRLDDMWDEWERWFIELGETHTSEPSLNFLRSPRADRSWLTAAATILDAATLRNTALALPFSANAETTYRAGVESMQEIGSFFNVDTSSNGQRSSRVTRAEFETALDGLMAAGAPLVENRGDAWSLFMERRSAYEPQLVGLCGLIMPPPAPWTSDRSAPYSSPRTLRRWRRH